MIPYGLDFRKRSQRCFAIKKEPSDVYTTLIQTKESIVYFILDCGYFKDNLSWLCFFVALIYLVI